MACREYAEGEFLSLFFAVIDAKNKKITYCNCGHEPPVLISGQKTIDLEKGGLVLGVDKNANYQIETLDLKKGDCIILYTDGLIDASNFEGQLWGRENFIQTARKYIKESAEQMLKDIIGYRRRFVGLAKQCDDTSLIVVKIHA